MINLYLSFTVNFSLRLMEIFKIVDGKVYFKEHLLKGLSAQDFEILYGEEGGLKFIVKDKKGICWVYDFRNKPKVKFLTTDIEHFSSITNDFAIDKDHVFLTAKDAFAIPNSDPKSFKLLNETSYFAKDRNQLYALNSYSGLSIHKGTDYDTLVAVNWSSFVTDKHHLYHTGSVGIEITNDAKYAEKFNPDAQYDGSNNFELNKAFLYKKYPEIIGWWHPEYPFELEMTETTPVGFHLTENAVFYVAQSYGRFHNDILLPEADVPSFEILSEAYAKDKNHIYCEHRKLAHIDFQSFKVIDGLLAEDKNNIFYNGYKVNCDKSSFKVLKKQSNHDYGVIAKDKNVVFSVREERFGKVGMRTGVAQTLQPIKNSDPTSFTKFSSYWAKDKHQVYCTGIPYKKANVDSFEHLQELGVDDCAKDNQFLFNGNGKRIVKGINGGKFKVLNAFWGKDDTQVFSFTTASIRPSIDVTSFKITDEKGGAEDKDYRYTIRDSGTIKKVLK